MTKVELVQISFDEWEKKFEPIENHLSDNAGLGGLLFETYGEEVLYAVGVANKVIDAGDNFFLSLHVWTYIDGDDGTYIIDGYHYVNRIGYLITKNPPEQNVAYEVFVDGYHHVV